MATDADKRERETREKDGDGELIIPNRKGAMAVENGMLAIFETHHFVLV